MTLVHESGGCTSATVEHRNARRLHRRPGSRSRASRPWRGSPARCADGCRPFPSWGTAGGPPRPEPSSDGARHGQASCARPALPTAASAAERSSAGRWFCLPARPTSPSSSSRPNHGRSAVGSASLRRSANSVADSPSVWAKSPSTMRSRWVNWCRSPASCSSRITPGFRTRRGTFPPPAVAQSPRHCHQGQAGPADNADRPIEPVTMIGLSIDVTGGQRTSSSPPSDRTPGRAAATACAPTRTAPSQRGWRNGPRIAADSHGLVGLPALRYALC